MENTVLLTDRTGGQLPDALRLFLVRHPRMETVGRVRWQPVRPARPGELGTGLDVLTLAVTGVLALPAAIETVRQWCTSPGQSDASVSMTVGEVTVTVTGGCSSEEIASMAGALTEALRSDADADD